MKTTTAEPDKAERRIVAGCLFSPLVCGQLAGRWEKGMLQSPEADRLIGWAVDHWKEHQAPPGKGITFYLESWSESANPDHAAATDKFLAEVLNQVGVDGEPNGQAIVTLADKHLKKVQLTQLADDIQKAVQSGQIGKAEEAVSKGIKVGLSSPEGVDLFRDVNAMQSTYAREIIDPLVSYPDGLGKFFGPHLRRDCFVAFMGMEKAGKSYWLLDIAWRAMLNRKRVAYFQVGDLSFDQVKDRFLVRAEQKPSWSEDNKWPSIVKIPKSIAIPVKDECARMEFSEKTFKQPFQAGPDWANRIKDYVEKETRSRRSFFKLFWFPTKTVTVLQVKAIVNALDARDWSPDVIVVDYADLLLACDRRIDKRDQVKHDWEQLRQISMERHCLLLTATQVNADSYKKKTLDRTNFSENHLKFAEVNGMVGISMTAEEKDQQIVRLNWVARREGQYSPKRCCSIAGCLSLSNPAVASIYP